MPGAPSLAQVTSAREPKTQDPTEPVQLISAPGVPAGVLEPVPAKAELPAPALPLTAVPPPAVVSMHVRREKDGFCIQAFEPGKDPRKPVSSPASKEKLIEAGRPAQRVHTYVSKLAANPAVADLLNWVKELRARYPSVPYLMIHEYTSTGIPWEMLPVGSSYLGAVVTTVRWEDFQDAQDRSVSKTVSFEAMTCDGEVLSYVDPNERPSVDPLLHQFLGKPASFATMQELLTELQKERGGVGLLYLLCHGYFVEEFPDSFLGTRVDRLTYEDLDEAPLKLLRRSGALIFLDACSVGRMEDADPLLPEGMRYGFPQLFLGHGARAVIGALAEVQVKYAVKLAHNLVKLSRQHPGRPVPELLRELREQAVEELRKTSVEDKSRWERWYFTFLYVYYGYPFTRLSLEPKGAAHGG
jgi:hypothetical protein